MAVLRTENGRTYVRHDAINEVIAPTRIDHVPVPPGLDELLTKAELNPEETERLVASGDAGLEAERPRAGWPPALAQVFFPGMPQALEDMLAGFGAPHTNPADEVHHYVTAGSASIRHFSAIYGTQTTDGRRRMRVVRRLLLWDIDGTLIRGGGVGSDAINKAAAAALGRPIGVRPVVMHGKTDPQILREIFLAADVAEDTIAELLPAAVAEAERLLALAEADLRRRGEVIDGVVEVLTRTAMVPGVRQSLVTGNLVGNAAVKLAAFDLTSYFDVEVGAYGTDHADRNELVPIALERVQRLRGERFLPREVWVIGDTPGDLAYARAAGVRCLLVGTGQIPMSELLALDRTRCSRISRTPTRSSRS